MKCWKGGCAAGPYIVWEENKGNTFKVNAQIRKVRVTTKRIEIECVTSK